MTCTPWQSRRNLSKINDDALFNEMKAETGKMRYSLIFVDGSTRNIRVGRLGLIEEIKEWQPVAIQRRG